MPALDALISRTNWMPTAGRSGASINMENAVNERRRREAENISSPGLRTVLPDPAWDSFWGGLRRAKDTAADEGMGFGVNFSGFGRGESMSTASAALNARTNYDPWTEAERGQAFQARRQQMDRANGLRLDEIVNSLKAGDENVVRGEAVDRARTQNAVQDELQRGTDQRAIDTFGRTEALRMNTSAEAARNAETMLPFSPAYQAALMKERGIFDTNDSREAAAATTAAGRTGSAAINAFGRVASAPTFTPDDTQRVGSASQALANRAGLAYPGAAAAQAPAAAKEFPADRLAEFAQANGVDEATARATIERFGYVIR